MRLFHLGRVSKLGWCAVVLFVESLVMLSPRPWTYFDRAQIWTSIVLSGHMSLVSVLLFRRERESGLLELVLVTPVSAGQLIFRQCCAFWRRFLLPVGIPFFLSAAAQVGMAVRAWFGLAQSLANRTFWFGKLGA